MVPSYVLVLVLLLLPWFFDLWLTSVIAGEVGVNVWLFFLVSAVLGVMLMAWEWRCMQTHWGALRRLEASPWQLVASARRGAAALLFILPGLGSDVLALVLLYRNWQVGVRRKRRLSESHDSSSGDGSQAEAASHAPPGVIEGEFRREE